MKQTRSFEHLFKLGKEKHGGKSFSEFKIPENGPFLGFSLRVFSPLFRSVSTTGRMEYDLRRARLPYTPVEYLSQTSLVVVIVSAFVVVITAYLAINLAHYAFLISSLGFLMIASAIALLLEYPALIIGIRKKKIDSGIPMAISFIATMASADIPVDTIFYELGRTSEYGEIAREARAISLSTRLFGKDIITAIKENEQVSPSRKFSEFLQGLITTITSGGDIKEYLSHKARQYQSELSTDIKRTVDSVGILAESYVTVGVAFPLILLIIIGVIASLSPVSPGPLIVVLYFIVLLVIPVIAALFIYFIGSTVREVEI